MSTLSIELSTGEIFKIHAIPTKGLSASFVKVAHLKRPQAILMVTERGEYFTSLTLSHAWVSSEHYVFPYWVNALRSVNAITEAKLRAELKAHKEHLSHEDTRYALGELARLSAEVGVGLNWNAFNKKRKELGMGPYTPAGYKLNSKGLVVLDKSQKSADASQKA